MPVYLKSERSERQPTAAERKLWDKITKLVGCIVGPVGCRGRFTIHHMETNRGGRQKP
jgi:hypothetical protein